MSERLSGVYSGPSSQTSRVTIQVWGEVRAHDLTLSDSDSAKIRTVRTKTWSDVASEVLQEHPQLWEELAAL